MMTDSGQWLPVYFTDSYPGHFCKNAGDMFVLLAGRGIARSRRRERGSYPSEVCLLNTFELGLL